LRRGKNPPDIPTLNKPEYSVSFSEGMRFPKEREGAKPEKESWELKKKQWRIFEKKEGENSEKKEDQNKGGWSARNFLMRKVHLRFRIFPCWEVLEIFEYSESSREFCR
jgi:hypothetical protein